MSKRKISRQQQRRIKQSQTQREQRAQRQDHDIDQLLSSGQLGPEEPGLLIAHFGTQADIERNDGTRYRCLLRQHLGSLVAGDNVTWRQIDKDSGVVVALTPRRSTLGRPDREGEIRPVAANIDQMIIVVAPQPELVATLLDCYLIAAESLNITPIILLNKIDTLENYAHLTIDQTIQVYQNLGYQLLRASAVSEHGLDQLRDQLKQKTSVLVGQSGVGKSSLISALMPEQQIRIGELSQQTALGKHTTSNSVLYHLPCGGDLIDSPGIREFALWHMQPTHIAQGYIEFRPFLQQCKFRDCLHQHEPDCAVKAAVNHDKISRLRYQNYLKIQQQYGT